MRGLRFSPDWRPGGVFLLLGCALTGVYFVLPASGPSTSVVYEGLGLVSVALTLWAIRLHRPQAPLPWILIALGNASSVGGDILYDLNPDAVSPTLSDAFYLAAYPLLAAALLILLVRAGGHHRLAALAEAGIATAAFALVQWVFLMHPALNGSGSVGERVVNTTYPAGDLVLLAAFAGFFVSPAWRKPAFWLLVGAVVAMVVGDEIYELTASSYTSPSPLDVTWMLSYVLFGAAALHPSMRELEAPRRRAKLRVSSWRIALLSVALFSPIALLLEQWLRDAPLEVPAVFTATGLISLLVVWRLTGILRALERLRIRERQARADADAARDLLAEQNERLLEVDRLKDEFVALVSHDLRTPLTSIVGYTELALEEPAAGPLGAERRAYLEVVSRSSERLLRLVDDLLFVARLQAGKGLRLEPVELDVAALAKQSVAEAQSRGHGKGLAIRYAGPDAARLIADRGRLLQLLDHVISNAITFTPAGGSIEVALERMTTGVALEVRDTGIGIAPGDAEQLFDRFYRSTRAVRERIPGTGLGLFIARAIADAHGGRISAHARDRGGTVFRIELPLRIPLRTGATAELVA